MKTLKTIITCSIFVFLGLLNTYAQQEKTTMDLLMQNEWTHIFFMDDSDVISIFDFTEKKFTEKVTSVYKTHEVVFDYYLSNEIETIFDDSKIGNVKNGKYIITRNKFSKVIVHEIINISDMELDLTVLRGGVPITKILKIKRK